SSVTERVPISSRPCGRCSTQGRTPNERSRWEAVTAPVGDHSNPQENAHKSWSFRIHNQVRFRNRGCPGSTTAHAVLGQMTGKLAYSLAFITTKFSPDILTRLNHPPLPVV